MLLRRQLGAGRAGLAQARPASRGTRAPRSAGPGAGDGGASATRPVAGGGFCAQRSSAQGELVESFEGEIN